jgi:hypothetical protein
MSAFHDQESRERADARRSEHESRFDYTKLHREEPAGLDRLLTRAPRLPARLPGSGRRPVLGQSLAGCDRHPLQGNRSRRASMSQSHPPPMGSLGRVHLHPGPGHALQRVPPARCVVCKGVIVHRRGAVGIRDHRCGRVFTCLLSASQQVGLRLARDRP